MASAFSICALVVRWRNEIPPGGTEANGIDIDDPKWLVGINAAQLAIALISNLSLLMNMARRVRFSIAQPVTIIGWYVSSFALIGLTACAAGPLKIEPSASHAFTQAYYYAIIAAVLYFLVATLMVVTVWGAYKGHYDKEFQLTMSQRTLMLQTISYLVYLLCGAAVYSHIEGWPYLDAVYYANFTLLTIGIGDFSPTTHLGRGLLFPFAIGGIIILGLVIGSIRSLVLERGKVKMGARMVEKERRRLIKRMESKKKGEILEPINEDKPPLSPVSSQTLKENPGSLNERQRREQEFNLMRQIQEEAATKRRWTSLIISGTTWLVLWFVGAAVFMKTEYSQDWTYFVSLYFSYTSLLTIGYGDIYPESNSGKPFFVFWSLLAIPSLTILISNMGDTIVKGIRDLTLWVGNFTVLPGEKGVKTTLEQTARKLTKGRMFDKDVETPPGILGETNKRAKGEDDDETGHKNDPESGAQRVLGDRADRETASAGEKAADNDDLPKSKKHYHLILIKEIGKVMKHLNSSPPRKYTFDEWAWYLKLVGEDESSAETHRKAPKKPRPDGEGMGAAMGEKDGEVKVEWSWVGNRSPLMGNKEEAEWVLERLTMALERELEAVRREEAEMEAHGTTRDSRQDEMDGTGRQRSERDASMDSKRNKENVRTGEHGQELEQG
jgi:potassium channel subfamily K